MVDRDPPDPRAPRAPPVPPVPCDRARSRWPDSPGRLVVRDLGWIDAADLATVDALARVALVARRLGRDVRVEGASPELRELLALAGLAGVVPCAGDLPLDAVGQPEQREEPGGVEEEDDPADPAV